MPPGCASGGWRLLILDMVVVLLLTVSTCVDVQFSSSLGGLAIWRKAIQTVRKPKSLHPLLKHDTKLQQQETHSSFTHSMNQLVIAQFESSPAETWEMLFSPYHLLNLTEKTPMWKWSEVTALLGGEEDYRTYQTTSSLRAHIRLRCASWLRTWNTNPPGGWSQPRSPTPPTPESVTSLKPGTTILSYLTSLSLCLAWPRPCVITEPLAHRSRLWTGAPRAQFSRTATCWMVHLLPNKFMTVAVNIWSVTVCHGTILERGRIWRVCQAPF